MLFERSLRGRDHFVAEDDDQQVLLRPGVEEKGAGADVRTLGDFLGGRLGEALGSEELLGGRRGSWPAFSCLLRSRRPRRGAPSS